ncbi:hypothetical protein AB4099_18895 [Bosea sp. 2KB_26]|uniref:hypothetical protein n=1 Tax=Bosea sp. 2KB_26 TaxID=3237475 RepID=UPI003F92CFAE
MSERGVFAVDRGIFDHPAFQPEPFTQREAWLWLVAEAAFKERSKRADGKIIALQRGQLCHSIRFMAEAWQWSKSRVDRFLTMLENRDMLRSETGTRTPIITICNYSDYQRVSLPDRDKSGTTSGTRAGQDRDKLEGTENTEIPSETSPLRAAQASGIDVVGEASRKARKRGSRLPEDWWPDEALKAYAREKLNDDRACRTETERFKNYWAAAAGKNAIKLDWGLTYKNWILKAQESLPRAGPTGSRDAPRRPSPSDRLLNAMNGMFDDDQPTASAQQPLRIGAYSPADKA